MILDKQGGGASWEPAKEIHDPEMTICCFPLSTAAFVIAEQPFGFQRDGDRSVSALGHRPLHRPARIGGGLLVEGVPSLNSRFGEANPESEACEQPRKLSRRT